MGLFDRIKEAARAASTYYHGSPAKQLKALAAGSYVTPDIETARLMGRHHLDTGKTWTDDDLAEPHWFGGNPKWKEGREPKGVAQLYRLLARKQQLDLMDNPYEHKVLSEMPVTKEASPRWAREMDADRISEAGKKLISQMKGLRPRQIGKDHIGEGEEKRVYNAFGGDDLGAAVSKRMKNEVVPGSAKAYMQTADQIGSPFNRVIPHSDSLGDPVKGWFEPKLTEVPKENTILRRSQGKDIVDLDPAMTDKLRRRVEAAGGKLIGNHSLAEGISSSMTAEFPGGRMVHDLRAPNVMLDRHGEPTITDALVTQKGQRIPTVQSRKVGPDAPGLLESIRKRVKSTRSAPAAATRAGGFSTGPEPEPIKLPSPKSRVPKIPMPAKPGLRPIVPGLRPRPPGR